MPTSKPQRLYSVATYDKRIAAAKAKGRELVAKRGRLIKSRDNVENIVKLTTRRRELVRMGARAELKKFDEKNRQYLGATPKPLKETQALLSKLVSRIKVTRASIQNLRTRVQNLTEKRAQSAARARSRKQK